MYQRCARIQCVNRKSTGVTEGVKNIFTLRKFTQKFTVLSLIKEKTCLLSFLPVDVKFIAVLKHNMRNHPHTQKVFIPFGIPQFSGQGTLTFVINCFYSFENF